MAKAMYVGIGGVARKVKNGYLGVGGVTRFVRRGYLGVSGVARYFLYDFGTASVHLSPASADTDACIIHDDTWIWDAIVEIGNNNGGQ